MNDTRRIYSIKEITRYIKDQFDFDDVLQDVWIRGEISNFTHHTRGHMYFTVKDEESKMRGVMFAGHNRYLKFIPKNGTRVLMRGSITVFERDGQYQFYAKEMQPDGIGSLYLAFEQLKQRLEAEGLFAPEHKKPIPAYPATIGVITSPTGAAIRDIITTLRRRYPISRILLYPVLVQGENAARSVSQAISVMNERGEADVLIIGRGGGSIEELWAFNEEIVARTIFSSHIPVISAVGHETDFTISDFVADVRAATPTAAAELAVPHILELRERLDMLSGRLRTGLSYQTRQLREKLNRLQRSYVFRQPERQLIQYEQQLDKLVERLGRAASQYAIQKRNRYQSAHQKLLQHTPVRQAARYREQVGTQQHRLKRAVEAIVRANGLKLDRHLGKLDALSPLKVMQRGYSLAFKTQGVRKTLVKSVAQVDPGDSLTVQLNDGSLDCQVWGIEEVKNNG
ncbi:exodeoxyribonuclease VII large subunit [Aneurinibacillus sp. Ricciae_BoGa-3]|uniref:exodeoxyribonuclease VII large subunit n=1 Tax=Aneurinibacillus sp. Ricciae_BoGa-3 TaxID=3022697 RepID=UPI00234228EB|nr:exodeoxyribonuclease VII large subunit [Aneurinibacillus sp. Ricciae_BoGa-3]WCK53140.1 exodeoxyribonuclease VII large subunit [Aneurinibacillus sp. Ricciae_BoGa-3]